MLQALQACAISQSVILRWGKLDLEWVRLICCQMLVCLKSNKTDCIKWEKTDICNYSLSNCAKKEIFPSPHPPKNSVTSTLLQYRTPSINNSQLCTNTEDRMYLDKLGREFGEFMGGKFLVIAMMEPPWSKAVYCWNLGQTDAGVECKQSRSPLSCLALTHFIGHSGKQNDRHSALFFFQHYKCFGMLPKLWVFRAGTSRLFLAKRSHHIKYLAQCRELEKIF